MKYRNVVLGRQRGHAQVAQPEQLAKRHLVLQEAGLMEVIPPVLQKGDHGRCLAEENDSGIELRKRLWQLRAPRLEPHPRVTAMRMVQGDVEAIENLEHASYVGIQGGVSVQVQCAVEGRAGYVVDFRAAVRLLDRRHGGEREGRFVKPEPMVLPVRVQVDGQTWAMPANRLGGTNRGPDVLGARGNEENAFCVQYRPLRGWF